MKTFAKTGSKEVQQLADGSKTTTRTENKTIGEPVVPDGSANVAGADKDISTFPNVPTDSSAIDTDPFIQHHAATALYQEVKLIQDSIKNVAKRDGYKAYVVRGNIQAIPYARHQPYDVYSTISFFSAKHCFDSTTCEPGKMPRKLYALPFLVTDNLEGTLTSRSIENLRQLGLQLAFAGSSAGGNIDTSKLQDIFENVFARDLNSLFTIGRISDNSIKVRIGAIKEGTSNYAMTPKSHPFTIVLLVDEKEVIKTETVNNVKITKANEERTFLATVQTDMIHAETGRALNRKNNRQRTETTLSVVKEHLEQKKIPIPLDIDNKDKENNHCDKRYDNWKKSGEERKAEMVEDLLYHFFEGDFPMFRKCLITGGWKVDRKRDLWSDIARSLAESPRTGASFELPKPKFPKFPTTQAVFLVDSKDNQMTTTLVGGENISKTKFSGFLSLMQKESHIPIVFPLEKYRALNGTLTLNFKSPYSWKINNLNLNDAFLTDAHLTLKENKYGGLQKTYRTILYKQVQKKVEPVFSVRTVVNSLNFTKGENLDFKIAINIKADEKKKKLASAVKFNIAGAELVSVKNKGKSINIEKLNEFSIQGDGVYDIELRHPDNSKKLMIKSKAIDGAGKPVGVEHQAINLGVSISEKN